MLVANRITEMFGVEILIIQAAMAGSRAPLASAVSNAGGMGVIETPSGRLGEIQAEIKAMRGLTDEPCGVDIAQAFVRDLDIVGFVVDQGSSSSPARTWRPGAQDDARLTEARIRVGIRWRTFPPDTRITASKIARLDSRVRGWQGAQVIS